MLQSMTGRQSLSLLCERVAQSIFKGANLMPRPLALLPLLLPRHALFQLQCEVLECTTTYLRRLLTFLLPPCLLTILLMSNRTLQPSPTPLLHNQSPNQGPRSGGNKLLPLWLMLEMELSLLLRGPAGTQGLRSNMYLMPHTTLQSHCIHILI